LLQKLDFGACYVYSPKGQSTASGRSRELVARLKRGDPESLPRYAQRIRSLTDEGRFPDFFGADVTLVPVPGSAPLVKGALWVPLRVAEALRAQGLARDVLPLLRRAYAVKKSAFQMPAERPTVQQHYDSMATAVTVPPAARIVLIDDVVTQGSTSLAAATRLAEAFPEVEIRAFAVVRTMSGAELEVFLEPCVGTIRPRHDRAVRAP
jgi:hypothetical protein